MMNIYPPKAVERAMKVQEIMLRAMSGQMLWFQAAEVLGISTRHMRRWKCRYERYGYDGLFDRRRRRPSPRRVPFEIAKNITTSMPGTSAKSSRLTTKSRSVTTGSGWPCREPALCRPGRAGHPIGCVGPENPWSG